MAFVRSVNCFTLKLAATEKGATRAPATTSCMPRRDL